MTNEERIQQTIQAIGKLRFNNGVKPVKKMIRDCQLEGAVIDMDKDGYFVHSFTPPQWLVDMPTAAELAEKKAAAGEVEVVKEKKAPKAKNENGACAQIRAWARANPEATKADGVAQFPDLNPSTIQIQMRKVRLGQV